MAEFKTYKDKLQLIDRYLYEEEDRLEEDYKSRQNYYVNKRLYEKDSVDYLEDIILKIKRDYFKSVKTDIRMLMEIYDQSNKIDKE